jgi:NifU-like protein involved in Fe-S cluster formation/bacterioferritin-associated ferredoxin
MDKNQWAYSEDVKRHFMQPQNILQGEVEDFGADGSGMIGSPACGDMMQVLIKVKDEKIEDFKWKTFGCASAIASTSALSEMVLENNGMSLEQAYKLTPEDIIAKLGGLPSNKIHCSVLGDKALRAAIDDYFQKNEKVNPFKIEESPVVCVCKNITEEDIKMEVLEGAEDFETVQKRIEIATMCGKCESKARELTAMYVEKYYKDAIYNPEG